MNGMKKMTYPFVLGAIFFGLIGFITFVIQRAVTWTALSLKFIFPAINVSTINPALLLILTLIIIFTLGIIIDKLLKKWTSAVIQQMIDKCPPVITEEGSLAFKIGEKVDSDGKSQTVCMEPLLHLLPYLLAGRLRIIPKKNLKRFIVAPLDLVTLSMIAWLGLEKFEIKPFEEK